MINRFFTLLLAASCLTAVGQSEYCLDGTVWDAALQGCVPESVACEVEFDYDGDGYVGSGDLLSFLTAFGASIPDEDADGVCDDLDECIGEYDECGVCNGLGAVYDCGCEECVEFVECGDPVSYQGYDYATVLIGEQCWFAENLRSENYQNGDAIPAGLSDDEWESTISGAVAVYGEGAECDDFSPDIDPCDPTQSLNEYGRLYNWYAVDDSRGLCPGGWHVPTDGEWTVITDYLGHLEGRQMKTDYGWYIGNNGTNSSGFSGLPGGKRQANGYTSGSYDAGYKGYWWSSSPQANDSLAWNVYLHYASEFVNRYYWTGYPRNGYSVRCIQDPE